MNEILDQKLSSIAGSLHSIDISLVLISVFVIIMTVSLVTRDIINWKK